MSNGIVIKIGGGGGAGVDDTARAAITALQNQKGAANGIATLNEDRKLSSDQVPDNVVTTGQDGKIPLEKLPEGLGGDGGVDIEARQAIATLQTDKADKSQVLTNVPEDAVFTDTITTINGKTGAITKADIVALGIPAQDTVTTINGKTGAISKEDILALGISEGGGADIEIVDNLETEAADKALSAKQGKVLGSQISDIANQIEDLQNSGVDTEARASIAQLESQINDVMTEENQVWEV